MQSPNFVLRVLFFCALVAAGFGAEAPRAGRVALVIGNHRYEPEVGALRNPDNDARAMARALRTLGFEVVEKHNVTRDELIAALVKFGAKLRGAEVGLFYFAGHGLSVAGANYLLPIKARYDPVAATDPTSRRLLAETKLFNAEQAVALMSSAGTACNLVILDACRNTAVARDPALRAGDGRGGLTEMNPPAGSLVAFATDAGRTAADGSGPNGLYTEELIRHLLTPGLSIEQVFKRTRAAVMKRTDGAQVPAEYSRLVGDDIVLAAAKPVERATPAVTPLATPAPPEAPRSLAEIQRLAVAGELEQSLLQLHLRGPDAKAASVLSLLLDRVKESLREPKSAKARAEEILKSCDLLLEAVEECLPALHPQRAALRAKAHNRRGDVLLLLDRPEEARVAFDTAAALAPEDGYIVYNRGRAYLALGQREQAREDFTAAAGARFRKSGVRKLAAEALAKMKE